MEGIEKALAALAPLGGLSAGGVLILLALAMFFGKIPTPSTVRVLEQRIADKEAEIARHIVEIGHWRTAWTNVTAAQLENSKQLEKLVEKADATSAHNEIVVGILQSLRDQAGLT